MNALDKFIADWEVKAVKYYEDLLKEYVSFTSPLIISDKREAFQKSHTKQEWNLMQSAFYAVRFEKNENFFKEIMAKEGAMKKAQLIARVEKKAGKIVDASHLNIGVDGGINGVVKGELKSVYVETIYAGGYNIQQLHYRVLVK